MRRAAVALLLAAFMLLSLCDAASAGQEEYEKYTAYFYDAFDTNITLSGYCRSEEEFRSFSGYAEQRFNELHRLFDIYHSYPGLNNAKTVNDMAGESPVAVPGELSELIALGKDMYELTGGAVNIAMGAVLKQWHTARAFSLAFPDSAVLPDAEELQAAARHCSIDDLVTDAEAGTVFLQDPDMSIDLGAIAKGFAVERISRELRAMGWDSFAINAGGNVRVSGGKPDGSGRRVAIKDPISTGEKYIAAVTVYDSAVVTSGVGERCFFLGGRRYHHIIDGKTLMPEERYLSVSIIYSDSAAADALSTALFNMELEEGRALAESIEGLEALWVLPDGTLEYTRGFDAADIIN